MATKDNYSNDHTIRVKNGATAGSGTLTLDANVVIGGEMTSDNFTLSDQATQYVSRLGCTARGYFIDGSVGATAQSDNTALFAGTAATYSEYKIPIELPNGCYLDLINFAFGTVVGNGTVTIEVQRTSILGGADTPYSDTIVYSEAGTTAQTIDINAVIDYTLYCYNIYVKLDNAAMPASEAYLVSWQIVYKINKLVNDGLGFS